MVMQCILQWHLVVLKRFEMFFASLSVCGGGNGFLLKISQCSPFPTCVFCALFVYACLIWSSWFCIFWGLGNGFILEFMHVISLFCAHSVYGLKISYTDVSVSFVSLSLECTQCQCNATMAFGFKFMQVGFFSVWCWTLMQWVCVVSLEKVESFKYGMKDQDSSCRKKTDSCILRKSRRPWTLFPHTRARIHLGPMPLPLATKHLAFGILSPSFPCKSQKYDQNCQNCH